MDASNLTWYSATLAKEERKQKESDRPKRLNSERKRPGQNPDAAQTGSTSRAAGASAASRFIALTGKEVKEKDGGEDGEGCGTTY